ncbi:hypothetical protein PUN28_006161 [Cardiocondyla obscurior]|uniref:MADF domain-containing protein n=1 Tax=Cardiocondyla obscurior TaxID=286306 RepID=A0AAW2G958_9HYME
MRSNAWEEIGKELKIKPKYAKEAWEKLRRCFVNAINRRRNKKSGDGANKTHPWKYEEEMSFFLTLLENRSIQGNLSIETAQDKSHEAITNSAENINNYNEESFSKERSETQELDESNVIQEIDKLYNNEKKKQM